MSLFDMDTGYDRSDPKHPECAGNVASLADHQRKQAKESPEPARGQWAWDIDYKAIALEAAEELAASLEDMRELARLEDQVANPPTDRITDETRWYRMRMDAIHAIKDRWAL